MENKEIGDIGEKAAQKYLENKKYQTIENNYRQVWGELDIIMKDPKGVLVFVEVKTLVQNNFDDIKPEDNMTAAKIIKLKRAANFYALKNDELIDENFGWRIDMVAIEIPQGEIYHPEKFLIRHYENI